MSRKAPTLEEQILSVLRENRGHRVSDVRAALDVSWKVADRALRRLEIDGKAHLSRLDWKWYRGSTRAV